MRRKLVKLFAVLEDGGSHSGRFLAAFDEFIDKADDWEVKALVEALTKREEE